MSYEGKPKLSATMLTDIGVVRDHNEDSAFVDPSHDFFIVADGMGGHAAGEVASAMAVDSVKQALENARDEIAEFAKKPSDSGRKDLVQILEAAVREAHKAVYERGINEPDKQGMGTTLDVLLVAGIDAFVAHVGDSRTYLIRDGRAAQITTDHTVAEVLVIEGKLTLEEAAASPLRTILVNAIGVAADVGVEMAHLRLKEDDQLLVCSDGLHDYFPVEQEIADRTMSGKDDSLQTMVDLAKERGGHDNITGVLIAVLDLPESSEEEEPAVPHEIGVDDTMPVDIEDLEARAKAEEESLSGTNGDSDESDDDESDDESDDDKSDDDKSDEQEDLAHADTLSGDSDLKTTVPMRPAKDDGKSDN